MRKLAIMAALASTAMATPALAVDNAWYVGVEGGAMLVEDTEFDFVGDDGEGNTLEIDDAIVLDYNTGFDVDLIGGYDLGMFRVEAELGWKRASINEATIEGDLIDDNTVVADVDGSVRIL